MTKEEKELLLKDLCARLPHGVHLFTNSKHHIRLLTISNDIDYSEQYWINGLYDIDEVKPYLRPLSSMTEEEKKEYYTFQYKFTLQIYEYQELNKETFSEYLDWLNAHHFDYRTDDEDKTLIEKGLALIAPKGMYNDL